MKTKIFFYAIPFTAVACTSGDGTHRASAMNAEELAAYNLGLPP